MKKFETKNEAYESQNFNPELVRIVGVPEQHVEAVKAFAALCVAHDAVNPEFKPDFTNYNQYKYTAWHEIGSPSGAGFSYDVCGRWVATSTVGSRLCSESSEAAEFIAEMFHDEYKKWKVYDRKIE